MTSIRRAHSTGARDAVADQAWVVSGGLLTAAKAPE